MSKKKTIRFVKDLYNAVEVFYTRTDSDDESKIYRVANKVGIDRESIKAIKIELQESTVSVFINTGELVIFKVYNTSYKDKLDIISKLIFLLIDK